MIDFKVFRAAMRGSYVFRRQSATEVERSENSLARVEERIIDGRKVNLNKKLETIRRRLRLEVSVLLHDEALSNLAINADNCPHTFDLMTGGVPNGLI